MSTYTGFIAENCAPPGATRIELYPADSDVCAGVIPLPSRMIAPDDAPLYRLGVISDSHIHLSQSTGALYQLPELQNAVDDCNALGVAAIIHCGDVTNNGKPEEFAAAREVFEKSSAPVYPIAGNHESISGVNTDEKMMQYLGHPLCYTVEMENDLLVFVGCQLGSVGAIFSQNQLAWLSETLTANTDRRVLLFEHVFMPNDCGNANGLYGDDLFTSSVGTAFREIITAHPNVIFFHGHSHISLAYQELDHSGNLNTAELTASVHVPSSTVTLKRDGSRTGQEGYVVDVHADEIILRGRDFQAHKFLPIATYKVSRRGSPRGQTDKET